MKFQHASSGKAGIPKKKEQAALRAAARRALRLAAQDAGLPISPVAGEAGRVRGNCFLPGKRLAHSLNRLGVTGLLSSGGPVFHF
jgi:hypothetical protein